MSEWEETFARQLADDALDAPNSERALLACVLLDANGGHRAFERVAAAVTPKTFGAPRNATVWGGMCAIRDRGDLLDVVALHDELAQGGMKDAGKYLGALLRVPIDPDQCERYARCANEWAHLRETRAVLASAMGEAQANGRPLAVVAQVRTKLSALPEAVASAKDYSLHAHALAAIDAMRKAAEDHARGVCRFAQWGIPSLDGRFGADGTYFPGALGGLFPGELFVIGGEPGAGKTTMVWSAALATARGNAHAPGRRVLVFSLEMSGPVLVRRIAGQMAGIPQERLKRGAFYPGEMSKLAGAMNELSALPIQVFDDCDTLDGIAARVRAELLRGEVGLVVIDYLQILRHQGSVRDENRADADRVQAAKRLAVQTDVPFLVVSAINKSAQHRAREGKELSAADAKGSGTEFAANVIFYLMCDDPKDKGARVGVTIQFAKNRDGASAPIPLIFDKPRGVFESVEGVGDREERRAQEAAEHDLINADGGDA